MVQTRINKYALRVVAAIVILAVGYVPRYLETMDFSSRWPLFYILNGVVISIYFCIIPPLSFLISHYSMRKFATSKIKSLLETKPIIDVIV